MQNKFVLTFDIDWAPDWCILQIADILVKKKIKATWFITHHTPAIRLLRDYPDLFEMGVHPNFHKGSTHGKQPYEVMEYLMAIVPEARSVRTHGLFQSTHLIKMMTEQFGIQYDASVFLPDTPNIVPHIFYTSKEASIVRIPYFWEDDFEMIIPEPIFTFRHPKYHVSGLKIFDFHPIHLCLNSCSTDAYEECKAKIPCITELTAEYSNVFVNSGEGIMTFFNEMTDSLVACGHTGYTITEIGDAFTNNYGCV